MKEKIQTLLVIIIIIILSIGITNKTFQNDTFYTIKIGESILKNGIDMLDHFSIHNIMYPYEHWLYDLFIYLLYNNFGFTGLYISNIVLTSMLGFILYFGTKKLYKNESISFIITIISLFLLKNFIATRAQLVSYIIFVLEIYSLESLYKYGKKKNILFLLILSIILANVHAAVWPMFFILFMPYIVAYLFNKVDKINIKNEKINTQKNKFFKIFKHKFENNNYSNIKCFFITFIICLISGLINPNNNQCFKHFILLKLGNSMSIIAEHQPTVLYNAPFFLVYILIILLIILFNNKKYNLKNLFFIIGLFLLSLSSGRHVSLFVTIGSFILVDTLSSIYINKSSILKCRLFTVFFACFISIFMFYSNINNKYISDYYPIKATNYINKHVDKINMRLYNEYNYGSYLLFKDIPVFIDSRASLYTKQFNKLNYDILDDYNEINTTGKYRKIFKKYNINYVLTRKYSILNYALKCDYRYEIVYYDKNYILYKKV